MTKELFNFIWFIFTVWTVLTVYICAKLSDIHNELKKKNV